MYTYTLQLKNCLQALESIAFMTEIIKSSVDLNGASWNVTKHIKCSLELKSQIKLTQGHHRKKPHKIFTHQIPHIVNCSLFSHRKCCWSRWIKLGSAIVDSRPLDFMTNFEIFSNTTDFFIPIQLNYHRWYSFPALSIAKVFSVTWKHFEEQTVLWRFTITEYNKKKNVCLSNNADILSINESRGKALYIIVDYCLHQRQ